MKEGWELKKLGEVCDNLDNKRVPITKNKRILGEIPYYGASGIVDYVADYLFDEDLLLVSEDGANLLARTYPIAFSISGKNWVNNHAHVLRFNNIDSQRFIEYYLNSIKLDNYVSGMAQPKLNQKSLNSIIVPSPPLPEQKQIVAILDKAFAAIDQAQANIEKNIENAKELFQSKLNEIFSQKGDGWEEKVLGDIGVVQTGTTPSTKDKSNYGDYIAFAKPPHFKEDGSIDTQESMLSKSGLEKGRLFKANSILMVCIGATIGKTGFSEKPISSNQQINALTPSNDYVPKLLYYALISPFVQNQVMAVGKSAQATLPIINKSKWLKLKVNLPLDKSVQTQIIETLENLKEFCMNTEKVYQQKFENLEDLKKSLLQKAFTGELTQKTVAV